MKKEKIKGEFAADLMKTLESESNRGYILGKNWGSFDDIEDDKKPDKTKKVTDEDELKMSATMGEIRQGELGQLMKREYISYGELETTEDIFRYFGFSDDEISRYGRKKIELFITDQRRQFLGRYDKYLNTLMTPMGFAEFRGVNYLTVLRWIKQEKIDVFQICGHNYVMVPPEDITRLDRMMLKKELLKDSVNGGGVKDREAIVRIYEKKYATEAEMEEILTPPDDVKEWCKETKRTPYGFGCSKAKSTRTDRGSRYRADTQDCYPEYCEWAMKNNKIELNLAVFSRRMRELGFTKYNAKGRRGFYYYAPIPDDLKEFYGHDEWTAPTIEEENETI